MLRRPLPTFVVGVSVLCLAWQFLLAHFVGDLRSGLNDDWYYLAMSQRPLGEPQTYDWWLTRPGFESLGEESSDPFAGTRSLWASPVNGLGNQPPFVYRLLVPMIVAMGSSIGIPNILGFQIVWVIGTALLGSAVFVILYRGSTTVLIPAVIATATTLVFMVSRPDPLYPDALFMGLTAWTIWALKERRSGSFFLLGFLASACKESGLLLALPWLVVLWCEDGILSRRMLAALGPPLGVLVPRLIVDAPVQGFNLVGLIGETAPAYWIALLLTACLLLISPLLALTMSRGLKGLTVDDKALVLTGLILSLATSAVALSLERMPLFAVPYFVCVSAWAATGWPTKWITVSILGLSTYAVSVASITLLGRSTAALAVVAACAVIALVGSLVVWRQLRVRVEWETADSHA